MSAPAAAPDVVSGGSQRGHGVLPGQPVTRAVAVAVAVAVITLAGWAGPAELAGAWRYLGEHSSPLPAGLLCPTTPGQPLPGPGPLAAISDLGHNIRPSQVARRYGCVPAAAIYDLRPRPPLQDK